MCLFCEINRALNEASVGTSTDGPGPQQQTFVLMEEPRPSIQVLAADAVDLLDGFVYGITLDLAAVLNAPEVPEWAKQLVTDVTYDGQRKLLLAGGSMSRLEWFRGRFLREAMLAVAESSIQGPGDFNGIIEAFDYALPALEDEELGAYLAGFEPRGKGGTDRYALAMQSRREQRMVFDRVLANLFRAQVA